MSSEQSKKVGLNYLIKPYTFKYKRLIFVEISLGRLYFFSKFGAYKFENGPLFVTHSFTIFSCAQLYFVKWNAYCHLMPGKMTSVVE